MYAQPLTTEVLSLEAACAEERSSWRASGLPPAGVRLPAGPRSATVKLTNDVPRLSCTVPGGASTLWSNRAPLLAPHPVAKGLVIEDWSIRSFIRRPARSPAQWVTSMRCVPMTDSSRSASSEGEPGTAV